MLNVKHAVVVGAATHATPEVVDSLVRSAWATLPEDAKWQVAVRLAERGADVDPTMLYCLRAMKSADRVSLIERCKCFSANVEAALANTKSLGVLRALAKRHGTRPETLTTLAVCGDDSARTLARRNRSLPFSSKVALATGAVGSGLSSGMSKNTTQALVATWCRQDPDFAEWYLTGMLTVAALTCGGPSWQAVDVFAWMPEVVDDRFAPVMTAAIASSDTTRRSIQRWVDLEPRLERRGSPVAVEAFVAACAANEMLGAYLATTCGATAVNAGDHHARRGTWRWTHAGTAAAALRVAREHQPGGMLHCAVLASRFVAGETLRAELGAAVETANVAALEALALNPNLDTDDVDVIVDMLPAGSLWRLHRAPLDTATRIALLRRCPSMATLILDNIPAGSGSGAAGGRDWTEAWLTRDVLEGFIADRGEMNEGASGRRTVSKWVSTCLARHPDAVEFVVNHARTGDIAVAEMVDALGAAFAASCQRSDEAQQVAKLLEIYDDRVSETWVTAARMARKR